MIGCVKSTQASMEMPLNTRRANHNQEQTAPQSRVFIANQAKSLHRLAIAPALYFARAGVCSFNY
jgi:hypothetical protein